MVKKKKIMYVFPQLRKKYTYKASLVKELPANAGDTGWISEPGRSHML